MFNGFNNMFSDFPSFYFQEPAFHPDRPRYYKDAMFPMFLSYSVLRGLRDYMEREGIPSKRGDKNHFDFITSIYENYVKWDSALDRPSSENSDRPLPGFLFSNKQFFWLTLIHKNCIKFQTGERLQ